MAIMSNKATTLAGFISVPFVAAGSGFHRVLLHGRTLDSLLPHKALWP